MAASNGGWWGRNSSWLRSAFRIGLGLAWLVNGILKFTSGYTDNFLGDVQASQSNAPGWLQGWYSFWVTQATSYGTTIVYTVGVLETLLGLALLFGLLRKIAYSAGAILSLLIWAVPEGFGGPYQNGAGGTDVGVGIAYAIGFLGLIVVNSALGPSRWSVDYLIEKKVAWWTKLAEFRRGAPAAGTASG